VACWYPRRMRRAGLAAATLLGMTLACGRAKSPPAPGAQRDAGAPADPAAMEQAAIAKLARADRDRLRACFQRELAIDPKLEDHMFTKLWVSPDGKVKDMNLLAAEVQGEAPRPDPPLSQKMAECLGAVEMKWTFPPTSWEGQVQLAEPLGVGGMLAVFSAKAPPAPGKEREAIRAVVREHKAELQECYEAYLHRKGSTLKPVRVLVQMTAGKDGSVTHASVSEPAKVDARLKACVLDIARRMKFPAPTSGDITVISYPFVFQPER
jgi:hypothetical protein